MATMLTPEAFLLSFWGEKYHWNVSISSSQWVLLDALQNSSYSLQELELLIDKIMSNTATKDEITDLFKNEQTKEELDYREVSSGRLRYLASRQEMTEINTQFETLGLRFWDGEIAQSMILWSAEKWANALLPRYYHEAQWKIHFVVQNKIMYVQTFLELYATLWRVFKTAWQSTLSSASEIWKAAKICLQHLDNVFISWVFEGKKIESNNQTIYLDSERVERWISDIEWTDFPFV